MNTKININEVKEAVGLHKYLGIMFQNDPKPMQFKFSEPVDLPIHSYFCKPFMAIWSVKGKEIERKIVYPGASDIKPKRKYDHLLEIPLAHLPDEEIKN